LDTKIKSQEQDPDKKWITTWNYNLVHLKRFFRWLYNHHTSKSIYEQKEHNDISESVWVTPSFINIKKEGPSGLVHILRARFGNEMNYLP
jgi:integrase/recombinase XerD